MAKPNEEAAEIQSVFGDLPDTFDIRNADGTISRVKEPCYNLLEPGFYGDTWYDEGEVVLLTICPNHGMQPLNRAAGERFAKWLRALPAEGARITVEDMTQAALMLAKDPKFGDMADRERALAVQRLAITLRDKRDEQLNGGTFVPPQIGRAAPRSSAPAMPNMRFTDPSMRGPGGSPGQSILHNPVHGNTAASQRVTPALGVPSGR